VKFDFTGEIQNGTEMELYKNGMNGTKGLMMELHCAIIIVKNY
jgi:hypothetical protein